MFVEKILTSSPDMRNCPKSEIYAQKKTDRRIGLYIVGSQTLALGLSA